MDQVAELLDVGLVNIPCRLLLERIGTTASCSFPTQLLVIQTDRQAAVKPKETRRNTLSRQPHILQHFDLPFVLSCGHRPNITVRSFQDSSGVWCSTLCCRASRVNALPSWKTWRPSSISACASQPFSPNQQAFTSSCMPCLLT